MISDDTYVRDISFKMASTSTMSVYRIGKVVNVLPNIFKVSLVSPIRCYQNPPNHGARLGINFQSMPHLFSVSLRSVELNSFFNSSAAAM